MPSLGLPPGFIPPVVVAPAVTTVVPVIAGAAATGVSLPVLPLVGAVVVGAGVAALAALAVAAIVSGAAQNWGRLNNPAPADGVYGPISGENGRYIPPNPQAEGLLRIRIAVPNNPPQPPIYYGGTVGPLSRGASVYEAPQPNGPNHLRYRVTRADGTVFDNCISGGGGGCISLSEGRVVVIDVVMPDGSTTEPDLLPWPEPVLPRPPAVLPAVAPVPAALPGALPTPTPQVPDAEPVTQPDTSPTTPTTPGRTAAPTVPQPAPPTPIPYLPPAVAPGRSTPTTPAGQVQPTPQLPPRPTPTNVHVVDGVPIPGNGPQATPQGMAQELGRIEKKLARLIDTKSDAPGAPKDRLRILYDNLGTVIDFFLSIRDSGEYEISSPCELDEDGNRVVVKVPYTGALQSFGVLSNKLDAIAQLLQEHKNLKQPNCPGTKPVLTGEWVAINFQSDVASPGGERPLRKVLRYRDQTAAPLEDHLAHWESFAWDAGPVIVISKNLDWGTPQVWAASIAEGKRVLGHAAQVAGVDLTDPKHEWVVTGSNDPRYGRTGRMRLDTRGGKFMRVTSRPGPSGLPSGFSPDS